MRPTRARRSGAAAGARVANEITMDELPSEWRVAGAAGSTSKYGNKRVEVDGIVFLSAREAARYRELKTLQAGGAIHGLTLQRRYELEINGVKLGAYVADFWYIEDGASVPTVEDCKGFRTQYYRIKKKLILALYGVTIKET